MNKKGIVFLAIFLSLFVFSTSQAMQYTFTPNPNDLNDLDHYSAYRWGINWNLPGSERITGAYLTFTNIYDWQVEEDHLYIHLLNTVSDPNGPGTPNWAQKTGYQSITITAPDNQGGGDFFSGQGVLLGNWNDPIGGYARNFNLVVPIPVDTLTAYLSNGNFGFGLDPDCHYYNQKVSLAIQTSVPEPATFFFLGTGLVGLAAIGRRKFQK